MPISETNSLSCTGINVKKSALSDAIKSYVSSSEPSAPRTNRICYSKELLLSFRDKAVKIPCFENPVQSSCFRKITVHTTKTATSGSHAHARKGPNARNFNEFLELDSCRRFDSKPTNHSLIQKSKNIAIANPKHIETPTFYSMPLNAFENYSWKYQKDEFSESISSDLGLDIQSFAPVASSYKEEMNEFYDYQADYSIHSHVSEDIEDGCPVFKVPRMLFNGMEGGMNSLKKILIGCIGQMVLPKRQWKKQTQGQIDSRHFMVMSYNLLAPFYCTESKFPLTEPQFLDWEYRRRQILDEITFYSPDFICLQELPASEFSTHFLSELSQLGYHGHFQKKKREHAADGCAILYQTSRFSLLEVQAFAYNERIPSDMPQDIKDRLSPFSNIALVCVFQNRQAKSLKVRVVTTHLHWDPAYADIKLIQASLLIEWLESANSAIPTVIAGDFNSKPGEPVMEYLIRGRVTLPKSSSKTDVSEEATPQEGSNETQKPRSNSPQMEALSVLELESEEAKTRMSSFAIQRQGVKLASAYNSRDLPFTNKTPDFEGIIDHILYSSGTLSIRDVLCDIYIDTQDKPDSNTSSPTSFEMTPILSNVPQEHVQIAQYGYSSYLSRLDSLPNRQFPSDHIALCAWLKWKTVPVLSNLCKSAGNNHSKERKISHKHTKDPKPSHHSSSAVLSSPQNWISLEEWKCKKQKPKKAKQLKDLASLSLDER